MSDELTNDSPPPMPDIESPSMYPPTQLSTDDVRKIVSDYINRHLIINGQHAQLGGSFIEFDISPPRDITAEWNGLNPVNTTKPTEARLEVIPVVVDKGEERLRVVEIERVKEITESVEIVKFIEQVVRTVVQEQVEICNVVNNVAMVSAEAEMPPAPKVDEATGMFVVPAESDAGALGGPVFNNVYVNEATGMFVVPQEADAEVVEGLKVIENQVVKEVTNIKYENVSNNYDTQDIPADPTFPVVFGDADTKEGHKESSSYMFNTADRTIVPVLLERADGEHTVIAALLGDVNDIVTEAQVYGEPEDDYYIAVSSLDHPWKVKKHATYTKLAPVWEVINCELIVQDTEVAVLDTVIAGDDGYLLLRTTRNTSTRAYSSHDIVFNASYLESDHTDQYTIIAIITNGKCRQCLFEPLHLTELMVVVNGEFQLATLKNAHKNTYGLPA